MSADNNMEDLTGVGLRARRAYDNESLTSAQRERHLHRLNDARRDAGSMSGLRIRRSELSVIAAVAALALIGIIAVQALLGQSEDGRPPSDSGQLPIDATATASDIVDVEPPGFRDGSCFVTPYSHAVPPDASQAAFTDTWIGSDSLWAGLGPENEGVWSATDLRVLWWRSSPVPLVVTGNRLDDEAPPLDVTIFEGYEGISHQITTLTFPRAGCWEVVGQSGDQEVRFVVDVRPQEEGPRYQAHQEWITLRERERQDRTPHPIPETCGLTRAWSNPDRRLIGSQDEPDFAYWQDDVGISIGTTHGLFFAGENDLAVLVEPELLADAGTSVDLNIFGVPTEGPLVELDLTIDGVFPAEVIRREGFERGWRSTLTFPEPGCWNILISVTRADEIVEQDMHLQVYVYPQPGEEQTGITVADIVELSGPLSPGEGHAYRVEVSADARFDHGGLRNWTVEGWRRMLDDGTQQLRLVARDAQGEFVAEFIGDGSGWHWNNRGWVESGEATLGILELPFELRLADQQSHITGRIVDDEIQRAQSNDGLVTLWQEMPRLPDTDWLAAGHGMDAYRFVAEVTLDQSEALVLSAAQALVDDAGARLSLGTFTFRSIEFMAAADLDDELFAVPSPPETRLVQYTPPGNDTLPAGLEIERHVSDWYMQRERITLNGAEGLELILNVGPSLGGFDPASWQAMSAVEYPALSSGVFFLPEAGSEVAWRGYEGAGWPVTAVWDDRRYRYELVVSGDPPPGSWSFEVLVELIRALSAKGE